MAERNPEELKWWLQLIETEGSVTAAAAKLNRSKESISNKFRSLPVDDPLYLQYRKLCKRPASKGGRPRIWETRQICCRVAYERQKARRKQEKAAKS